MTSFRSRPPSDQGRIASGVHHALHVGACVLLIASVACATGGSIRAEPPKPTGEAEDPASSADTADTRAASPEGEKEHVPGSRPPAKRIEYDFEPDGEWQVDDQGREYFAVEVPREPYYTIHNGRVMLPPGASYELLEVTDSTVTVKIYNPASIEYEGRKPDQTRQEAVADLSKHEIAVADVLTFQRTGEALPKRGQWRQGFRTVDMNGDGHLDIVHGPARKGDGVPKIFLGDGAGNWRLWREARYEGVGLDYGDIGVADFDGDGNLDLAIAVHLRGVAVLRGNGEGTFRSWGEGLPYWEPGREEAPPFSSRTLEILDWNRDGRPDLLTLGEGPRLMRAGSSRTPEVSLGDRGAILFLNRGAGQFERYDQGTGRRKIFGDGLAVGDFDGDGLADFAVASNVRGATELVKMGRKDGTWEDVSLGTLVRPASIGSVHAADLDGDGRDELLIGYIVSESEETRWTGIDRFDLGDEGWSRQVVAAVPEDRQAVTAIETGDLDGDGSLDLVALTGRGDRWVFLADDEGSFVREASSELTAQETGCEGHHAEIVELGEDDGTVLLMGFAGESGTEQLIPGLETRCPSQGSLEAWKVRPGS